MAKRKYYKMGEEAGKAAGSWIIDGNTTAETAQRIIDGYDANDCTVMDLQPSPLSGEWAGESISELFGKQPTDSQLDDYENGYSEGFWAEVIRSAKAVQS